MCIKFILQAKKWLIPIVGIYIAGESCHACTARRSPTPPIPKDDIHPGQLNASIDHSDAEDSTSSEDNASSASSTSSEDSASSVSSGFASGSSSSVSSGFASGSASSVSSGFSSGSASSVSSGFSSGSASSVSDPSTDFAGLPNVGNSCYMNTVLQVIAALYEDAVHNPAIEALIKKINTGSRPLEASDMNDFIEALPEGGAKELAKSRHQHDPHEFILLLTKDNLINEKKLPGTVQVAERALFKKGEEMYKLALGSPNTEFGLSIPFHKKDDNSFKLDTMIEKNWETSITEPLKRDPNESERYNGSFRVDNKANLEAIKEDEEKSITPYIKQTVINNLSPTLCIQLKRFSNATNKIEHKVDGTLNITITLDPALGTASQFALNGCIVHRGGGTTSGHYIAYVKRAEQWYEANDRDITKIDVGAAEAASRDAYLFFYKKI